MVAVGISPSSTAVFQSTLGHRLIPAPPHVVSAFDHGTAVFLVDLGHCACDRFSEPLGPRDEQRLRIKYGKRGWNNARIERVLAEQRRRGGLDSSLLSQMV